MSCEDGGVFRKCAEYCFLDVGRSAVYIVYNSGPRMLLWGRPESIGKRGDILFLNFVT